MEALPPSLRTRDASLVKPIVDGLKKIIYKMPTEPCPNINADCTRKEKNALLTLRANEMF